MQIVLELHFEYSSSVKILYSKSFLSPEQIALDNMKPPVTNMTYIESNRMSSEYENFNSSANLLGVRENEYNFRNIRNRSFEKVWARI